MKKELQSFLANLCLTPENKSRRRIALNPDDPRLDVFFDHRNGQMLFANPEDVVNEAGVDPISYSNKPNSPAPLYPSKDLSTENPHITTEMKYNYNYPLLILTISSLPFAILHSMISLNQNPMFKHIDLLNDDLAKLKEHRLNQKISRQNKINPLILFLFAITGMISPQLYQTALRPFPPNPPPNA